MDHKKEDISIITENQKINEPIAKKIKFESENLKRLNVIVANEFFGDESKKPDDFISEIVNRAVSEYFKEYISKLK